MWVRITRADRLGGQAFGPKGAIIDVPDPQAQELVKYGIAEPLAPNVMQNLVGSGGPDVPKGAHVVAKLPPK